MNEMLGDRIKALRSAKFHSGYSFQGCRRFRCNCRGDYIQDSRKREIRIKASEFTESVPPPFISFCIYNCFTGRQFYCGCWYGGKVNSVGGKSFGNPYLLLAINPASHMTADAIINIRTNVLTCSFHLNERIIASPMTAMIIGRSIKDWLHHYWILCMPYMQKQRQAQVIRLPL